MWSPALAAILTQIAFRGSLGELGWRLGPTRYLLWGALIPLAYSAAIYALAWATGLAGFQSPPANLVILFVPGLLLACFAALGEEIGWRGFLVPHLMSTTTFRNTVLISWIVWAVWHYPAIIWADYHSEAPLWFDLTSLTIAILGMSAMTAWMRLRSGSIWPAVIWHGVHNFLIQTVFLSMTVRTEFSGYVVDDFGLGVMVCGAVLAAIFLRSGAEFGKKVALRQVGQHRR
jgi:membrane protease YdiL (CAAX protease family)